MRDLWSELWRRTAVVRTGASGSGVVNGPASGESVYMELAKRYVEPHRHYHTLGHIAFCLERLEDCGSALLQPEAVEMAVWFHDAVYVPSSMENEAESAALAGAILGDAGFARTFIELVAALVLVTRHSGNAFLPDDPLPDAGYLADIDLSILGEPEPGYELYREGIRKEYGFLPDPEFRKGRTAFLEGLLEKPALFSTALFRERCEARARINIRRELTELNRV